MTTILGIVRTSLEKKKKRNKENHTVDNHTAFIKPFSITAERTMA